MNLINNHKTAFWLVLLVVHYYAGLLSEKKWSLKDGMMYTAFGSVCLGNFITLV